MNKLMLLAAVAGGVVLLLGLFIVWRKRRPVQLNQEYFQERWQELQKRLRDKAQWSEAVLDADNLLDEALKKKRIKGRNMGERLVKAQRQFSDNDSLWFGHKLRSRIDGDPTTKLKEKEVKQALIGLRQALKDLGALA
jgi:hypothetical protein